MQANIKLDHQDLTPIAQLLFGGGLQDNAQPPDNYIMAPDASGNPAPLPPSPGRDVAAPAQPSPTKLTALQQLLSGSTVPVPQPDTSAGMDAAAMPPPDLATSMTQTAPPRKATFAERHPREASALEKFFNFVQDASAGAGAPTFGQGDQAAVLSGERRDAAAENSRKLAAQIADEQSQTNLRNAQAARMGKYSTVVVNGVTYEVPNDRLAPLLGQQTAASSREKVATIAADNRTALQQLKNDISGGKIKWIKPAVDEQGHAVLGAYDANGNLVHYLDRSIGPAWLLPVIRSGVKVVTDDQGNFHYVPVTSTTIRQLPPDGHGRPPQLPSPRSVPLTGPTPQPGGNTSGRMVAGGARPVPASSTRPVMQSNGQPLHGLKSVDSGYAFDPKSDNWVLTSRGGFQGSGLTNFVPASAKQITDDRRMVTRLQDVERKTDRYANDFAQDISTRDRSNMAAIIADDRLHLGISGTVLPTGWLGKLTDSELFQNMSPEARARTIDYFQLREAMGGYNTVFTGSARSSDKLLQLQHDAIPSPLWKPEDAQTGFQRWRENLIVANRGLPVIPGVNDGREHPLPPINGAQPSSATGSGGMVMMRAPNGQTKPVPADQVQHYKSLGATVVH